MSWLNIGKVSQSDTWQDVFAYSMKSIILTDGGKCSVSEQDPSSSYTFSSTHTGKKRLVVYTVNIMVARHQCLRHWLSHQMIKASAHRISEQLMGNISKGCFRRQRWQQWWNTQTRKAILFAFACTDESKRMIKTQPSIPRILHLMIYIQCRHPGQHRK